MIDLFRGVNFFLSNFYPAPVKVNGIEYATAEHAYQAAKCVRESERHHIWRATTPAIAKTLGKKVRARDDWEEVKLDIMYAIVLAKFRQNPRLRELLLATGRQKLVEGNWWHDTYWGVCDGRGENHLGKILMRVRDKLRKRRS